LARKYNRSRWLRDLTRVFVGEVAVTARSAAWPVARLHRMPRPNPSSPHPPVVMTHGFLGHADMLRPIARALLNNGWGRVVRLGYPSTSLDLEGIIDRLRETVLPLARESKVDLIGHSLGAVACRAWIKCLDGEQYVRRFISLGGPHAGTNIYRLAPQQLRDALAPDGAWVKRCNEGPEPVPTTVIRARYDQHILPPEAAQIPGAEELLLKTYGHNGLLWAKESHQAIMEALTKPL
jgi:triacylglycerol lipase